MDELGAVGTRAVMVVARGLGTLRGPDGRTIEERTLLTARQHGIRIVGGGTLGILSPNIGLNASFARVPALPGNLGFVSQSDAVGTLLLDWAHPRRVGFSHFVSLGDAADVGFGEVLDYLGSDPDTRAILLYVESLRERRSFMAAARGAARNKPVLAIKAGRGAARIGAPSAISADTLSLVEPDDVFDAALRRAGIVRVRDIGELFDAVQTLAHARPLSGERLAVVSNGGGVGLIVADELDAGGLGVAGLSPALVSRLRPVMPPGWDGRDPLDILVDAPADRYARRPRGPPRRARSSTRCSRSTRRARSPAAPRSPARSSARSRPPAAASVLASFGGGESVAAGAAAAGRGGRAPLRHARRGRPRLPHHREPSAQLGGAHPDPALRSRRSSRSIARRPGGSSAPRSTRGGTSSG